MNIPEVLSDKLTDEILEKGLYFDHDPSDGEVYRTIQRDHDAINWLRWFVEWGDEICMEHGMKKRRRCDKCWQELEDKLAELEGK